LKSKGRAHSGAAPRYPITASSAVAPPAGLQSGNTKLADVPNGTRFERWLERTIARATTPRGAAIVIAGASTAVTFGAGLLMTVVDRESYPSVGSGLWWAVQTVTTVGYGDHVPENVVGRLVAAAVMLLGVGFLTIITAAITSTFISRSRLEQLRSGAEPATAEQLRQVSERLDRIEAALTRAS
jgi:voltage-gated potassium channel